MGACEPVGVLAARVEAGSARRIPINRSGTAAAPTPASPAPIVRTSTVRVLLPTSSRSSIQGLSRERRAVLLADVHSSAVACAAAARAGLVVGEGRPHEDLRPVLSRRV